MSTVPDLTSVAAGPQTAQILPSSVVDQLRRTSGDAMRLYSRENRWG
jgi:hypothetical protein